ncbi:hypothetical protein [Microbacterium sp. 2FI]|uniref:hypothetical protein n=1 Tax=Microbacterium sp. 2FI TaxID=2502193 RepID=UPI0010F5B5BC|nr:hypothetical protein [Microbacterium sp. 2FI]
MTPSLLPRRIAAVTIAVVAVFGVTACSAFPLGGPAASETAAPSEADASGDEGQSTQDACALVQETIEEATAEFDNLDAENPAAVVEAMEAAAQSLADVSSEVTNDEVAALLPSLESMFEQVSEVMAAIVAGETDKLTELSDLGTSFQETTTQFQELCAA